jgi:hypothetical protein
MVTWVKGKLYMHACCVGTHTCIVADIHVVNQDSPTPAIAVHLHKVHAKEGAAAISWAPMHTR